jgi:hypothetical protein
MKKLIFGLAAAFLFCFVTNNASAQVQDTLNGNDSNRGQQTMPADTTKEDSKEVITPAPNNPTTSDTTNRNNGLGNPVDVPPTTPINPSPGSRPLPEPQPNVPDLPRPNNPADSPTVPSTGAPI